MSSLCTWLSLPATLAALLSVSQDPPPERQGPVPGNPGARGDEAWRRLGQHREDVATRESDPARVASEAQAAEVRAALVASLAKAGVTLDLEAEELRLQARIGSPRMPLEFLLVNDRGAEHESLLVTGARPSAITTAVHLLGLKPGRNVSWVEREPFPTEDEVRSGARTHDILAPEGDGLFVYVSWEENGRRRSYRAEDLVVTEHDGRVMPYTSWVFLGSRFVKPSAKDPEYFAADVEGDVISICYFAGGAQVFTNPHPLALRPIFWPNHTLVPERGTAVEVVLTRREREATAR
ncbi:MAG: hypothetical protein IPN34_09190 [Planctomycetes bacterium]|nr:hypothetical protein [Planctomycetota bacterium]